MEIPQKTAKNDISTKNYRLFYAKKLPTENSSQRKINLREDLSGEEISCE
jgi:hypothetical protein